MKCIFRLALLLFALLPALTPLRAQQAAFGNGTPASIALGCGSSNAGQHYYDRLTAPYTGWICDGARGAWALDPGSAALVGGATAVYLPGTAAGTTWPDASGHGYNGTFGSYGSGASLPTILPYGLQFYGNEAAIRESYVQLPAAACNGAGTVQVWARTLNPEAIGSDAALFISDGYQGVTPQGSPFGQPGTFSTGHNVQTHAVDRLVGDNDLAYESAVPALYINGRAAVTPYLSSTAQTVTATSKCYVGGMNNGTGYGAFNGIIYAIAFYPGVLTPAQILQNDTYVQSLLRTAGYTWQSGHSYSGNVVAYLGDSRVNVGGAQSALGAWPYLAYELAPQVSGGNLLEAAHPGTNLVNFITAGAFQAAEQVVQKFNGQKILVVEGGINDLSGSATASSIYSALTTLASSAHALGQKVVASTVEGATICQGACATQLAAYNADVIAGYQAGTFDGLEDFGTIPVLTNYNNTTYFLSDKTHETTAGNQALAPYSALGQLAASGSHAPFWLDVQIPYAFVTAQASTQTLPLLHLGPRQKVCGATLRVTTAFAQAGASALTLAIGDSGGTATQYLAATSLLAAGSADAGSISFVSSNGTVQASIVSTGGTAPPSAGAADISLCVLTQ